MNAPLLAANLGAWWLQSAALLGAGLFLPALLRIRDPRARLALAYSVLIAAAVLPLLQPLRAATPADLPAFRVDLLVLGDAPRAASAWSSPWGWLLAALAAGALGRLAWLAAGLFGLNRMKIRAVPLVPEPPSVEIARRLSGAGAPVLSSKEVSVPLTAGGLRPAVLVPPSFPSLPLEAQRAVLCHEFLHVRRGDTLVILAEEAFRALLWFHPAIWAVLSRVGLWREQAVDAEVVRLTGDRCAYLQALSGFAHAPDPAAAATVLPFHRPGHLLKRMAFLVKEVPMKKNRWFTAFTASAAAALLIGTGALAVRAFPVAAAGTDDTVYKLGGDVKEPVEISRTQPTYPEAARSNRLEGTVVIEAIIDQKGAVTATKTVKSPDDLLSQAAIEAVQKWTYKPATKNGQPVKVLLTITVTFRLS
jgi:TonB family protein